MSDAPNGPGDKADATREWENEGGSVQLEQAPQLRRRDRQIQQDQRRENLDR